MHAATDNSDTFLCGNTSSITHFITSGSHKAKALATTVQASAAEYLKRNGLSCVTIHATADTDFVEDVTVITPRRTQLVRYGYERSRARDEVQNRNVHKDDS